MPAHFSGPKPLPAPAGAAHAAAGFSTAHSYSESPSITSPPSCRRLNGHRQPLSKILITKIGA